MKGDNPKIDTAQTLLALLEQILKTFAVPLTKNGGKQKSVALLVFDLEI